AKREESSKSS
ncbi:hypothetical protein A2U01_0101936, partial [Trifolium medium]|nr:hypothetical protein [Trifolium medium]